MFELKITYGGKNYSSITDAITKGIVDGIKESVTKALKPFEQEIKKSGGQIIINLPDNMKNMNVQVRNVPEELKEKITKALQ